MNTIKTLLRGLFSNQVIIDNRKSKWWLCILIGILSLIIAIIPMVVTYSSVTPGNILYPTASNLTYCVDEGLYAFSKSQPNLVIKNGKMDVSSSTTFDYFKTFKEINANGIESEESKKVFSVYFLNSDDNEQINAKQKEIEQGTNNIVNSYALFTPSYMYLKIYEIGAVNDVSQETMATPVNTYVGTFSELDGISINSFYDSTKPKPFNFSISEWSTFMNDAYNSIKVSTVLITTLWMTGLNAVIALILSLTLFALSRTKSNVNGIRLKYSESLRMVLLAALSPALLTLISGFLLTMLQSIGFVLFIGLRTTWLGMKISSQPANSK